MDNTTESYKKLREAFVSDHYGSSVSEINQITVVAPAAVLLWSILQSQQKLFQPYTPLKYLADFLLNACAILAATTVYSSNPVVLIGLLVLPSVAAFFNPPPRTEPKRHGAPPKDRAAKTSKVIDVEPPSMLPMKPFVTHYRGAMMVVTCACILAVDFPVFPRRFAKTESLGTSLMDLGVGSFVFSAGVVSARQHLKTVGDRLNQPTFLQQMRSAVRHSLPLVLLGLIRLYTVKRLDYAEHVTEYGVHWNFFFTLAVTPPFVALLRPIFRLIPSFAIIGYAVSLVQQTLFNYTPLVAWAILAPREDWLTKNREGLVSLPGYLAIFLCGYGIGTSILQRDQTPASSPESANDLWLASMFGGEKAVKEVEATPRHYAIVSLAKWTVIWCVVYYFTTGFYGPRLVVSRRLGNMAYVVWVNAFNCCQLLLFCLIETVLFPGLYLSDSKAIETERVNKATSRVLRAFNNNGLTIFLVANLLTGLINLSMKTIVMDDVPAMAVLITYMGVLAVLGVVLDHRGISMKL